MGKRGSRSAPRAAFDGANPFRLSSVASRVPQGFYTRGMLKEKLGLTEAELKFFENRNVIRAEHVNAQGWRLFSHAAYEAIIAYRTEKPKPLIEVRPAKEEKKAATAAATVGVEYTDAQAQTVFKMIQGGRALHLIVTEAAIGPAIVRKLAEEYASLSGALFLSGDTLAEINKLPLEGEMPLETAADVHAKLALLAQGRLCTVCRRNEPPTVCVTCLKSAAAKNEPPRVVASPTAPKASESMRVVDASSTPR